MKKSQESIPDRVKRGTVPVLERFTADSQTTPLKSRLFSKDYSLPNEANTSFQETAIYFALKDSLYTNPIVFSPGCTLQQF